MKATQQLSRAGQGLWLDNITRDLLTSGALERYIKELSVTGLTSNPTIFDHAIKSGASCDAAIRVGSRAGKAGEIQWAIIESSSHDPAALAIRSLRTSFS
jgi:transaldolase